MEVIHALFVVVPCACFLVGYLSAKAMHPVQTEDEKSKQLQARIIELKAAAQEASKFLARVGK